MNSADKIWISLTLKNLLESAHFFGAERLINALKTVGMGENVKQAGAWESNSSSLLREMKLVLASLPTTPTPKPSQPKQGKKSKPK